MCGGGRWYRFTLTCSLLITFLAVAAAVVCASHPPADHHHVMHLPLCIDAGSAELQESDAAMFFANRAGFPTRAKRRNAVVPHAAVAALQYGGHDCRTSQSAQTPDKDAVSLPRLLLAVLHL